MIQYHSLTADELELRIYLDEPGAAEHVGSVLQDYICEEAGERLFQIKEDLAREASEDAAEWVLHDIEKALDADDTVSEETHEWCLNLVKSALATYLT